jgi:peptidoglycan biosynthesis protein MviN/MurJ (putative lipid II flippase)
MPALAVAGITAFQTLAVLVLANRVEGGVVASEIGLTFCSVVVALGATPVALSMLPRLARLHAEDDRHGFRDTAVRGIALDGTAVLFAVGMSFSASTTVGAWHLAARLQKDSGGFDGKLASCGRRVTAAALAMAVLAWGAAVLLMRWVGGRPGSAMAIGTAALLGAAAFLSLQAWWRSPELSWVVGGLARVRRRDGGDRR